MVYPDTPAIHISHCVSMARTMLFLPRQEVLTSGVCGRDCVFVEESSSQACVDEWRVTEGSIGENIESHQRFGHGSCGEDEPSRKAESEMGEEITSVERFRDNLLGIFALLLIIAMIPVLHTLLCRLLDVFDTQEVLSETFGSRTTQ